MIRSADAIKPGMTLICSKGKTVVVNKNNIREIQQEYWEYELQSPKPKKK